MNYYIPCDYAEYLTALDLMTKIDVYRLIELHDLLINKISYGNKSGVFISIDLLLLAVLLSIASDSHEEAVSHKQRVKAGAVKPRNAGYVASLP